MAKKLKQIPVKASSTKVAPPIKPKKINPSVTEQMRSSYKITKGLREAKNQLKNGKKN